MKHRKLLASAIAAIIGVAALPYSAEAAWKGLRNFNCDNSSGNWNFDGLYGPFTTRAIQNFQRSRGLKADGVAGPDTYAALGLKYRRTLRCGMGGNDVFLLQQTLASSGFWYGGAGDASTATPRATARPTARPTSRPTPAWTEPPVMYTPGPEATPTPEASPTDEPMNLETPEPTSTPDAMLEEAPPENRPTFEAKGGDWMVPLNAGSTNYDYTFSRPVWTGEAALWFGDLGIGGDVTVFNQTWVDYRPTQYFQQNTMMYDALVKYRFDRGYYQVFGGYRGIGAGDVNFGTVGVAMDRPLLGSWLWLQAKGQAGHTFSSAYFLDGNAGLGLRFNPLELQLGFRHLAFQNGVEPLFNLNGPTANLKVAF